jgi:hypothetical protein
MRLVLRLAFILVLLIPLACAQSTNATITGRVVDPTNLLVTDAKVEVISLNTSLHYSGQTNREGLFTIVGVPPGPYRAEASKAGFRTVVREDVVLRVQDIVALNFTLPIGSVSETVTVTGGAPIVDTLSASVSTVVDQSYIANMPLNGRSFQDLILLTPGVVTSSPQSGSTLGQDGEFSVNGQRTDSNNYTVDGVSANVGATSNPNVSFYATTDRSAASGSVPGATQLGTTQALVPVDALAEFRVQSSSYSAEYGRNPGGQFAFETKSGTNHWHGTVFDYLRNDVFDATDYFTNYLRAVDSTLKKTAVRQNDFGGTFGGPLRLPYLYSGKDKTFFFVSYEGMRLVLPQPASITIVPDLCMRGDITSCPVTSGGVLRTPAATELLPVVNAYALPNPNANSDPDNGTGEFIGTWSNPGSINTTSVRFDHSVSDKLRLFFRFSNTTSDSVVRDGSFGGGIFPATQLATNASTLRTYTVGANSILSNRASNEFRLNYSSNSTTGKDEISPFGGSTPLDLNQATGLSSFSRPAATVFFILGQNFVQQATESLAGAQRQWNLVDTMSVSAGRHRLSFGGDYRRLAPFAVPSNPLVFYLYFSENDIELDNGTLSPQQFAPAHPLYMNFSLFAQDEWKATSRLNLSLGLRWEVNPPPGVTEGLMPYTIAFQPDPNNWTLAPQGTRLWKTTWFNFAPRVGIAYSIRDNSGWETVLRAGGGIFFDSGQQTGSVGFGGPGFSTDAPFIPSLFPGDPVAQLPPFVSPPAPPFLQLFGFYPHLQLPYTGQWNFSLEQALGKSQAVTASYVGSHAARLLQDNGFTSAIAINPVQVFSNGLSSDYHAMQLQFRRRLSRGLTSLASYTWSHCLDYGSSNFNNGYTKANCDFDVRHNASGAFSYDLPSLGHGGLGDAILGHWGLDDRFTARSSFPVELSGTRVLNPPTGQQLSNGLDFVPGEPIYLYGANCAQVLQAVLPPGQGCPGGRAINPNAFIPVLSGLGHVPRNFARGFGAWQMDLAVRMEFPIHERLKLQFRAEAFNVFNHPNFGMIDGRCFGTPGMQGCTNPQFGQATATLASSLGVLNSLYQMGGPRSMQFALKLVF